MRVVVDGLLRMMMNGSAGGYELDAITEDALAFEQMLVSERAHKCLESTSASTEEMLANLLLLAARLRRIVLLRPSETYQLLYSRITERLGNDYEFKFPFIAETEPRMVDPEEDILVIFAEESDVGEEQQQPKEMEDPTVEVVVEAAISTKVCFKCYQPGHMMHDCTEVRVRRPRKKRRVVEGDH